MKALALPVGSAPDSAATSRADRIDYLDGWRGLAILLVLQGHFLPWAGWDTGRVGVDLFFCLSGLLMSRILFAQRMPVGTFYKRRVSRVLPAFIAFVLVISGLALARRQAPGWGEFTSTLFFLRTYLPAQPDIWHSGLPIGHLWSLNVEEHCYLLLGALALIPWLRGREAWVLLAAVALSLAANHHYATTQPMRVTSYEIRTEVAGSFLLCSAAYQRVRHVLLPWVRPWMPLAAVGLGLAGYWHGAHWWASEILTPLALSFAVNHLGEAPAQVTRLLATPPLRRLGLWSYSIYLWQQPFFEHRSSWPAGIALVGAILVGVASYHLWEAPCRSWLNRHWQ